MHRTVNWLQIAAALLLALLGAYVTWQGSQYEIGSPSRMGPGFFPIVSGSILTLLAVLVAFGAAHAEKEKGFWIPRPIFMISASFITFALLLERYGLVPAIIVSVVLGALAESPVRPVATLATAVGLSLMGVVVFIYGLGISVPAIQW